MEQATLKADKQGSARQRKNSEKAEFTLAQELGGIELLDASYQKQNFSRHSHEGYTVGVIETGAQKFFRTGSNHLAPQNSIILAIPISLNMLSIQRLSNFSIQYVLMKEWLLPCKAMQSRSGMFESLPKGGFQSPAGYVE